jgi:dTMP kinase
MRDEGSSDPRRFPFIALEGTDGSGKSTLRVELAAALRAAGFAPIEFGQHSWLSVAAARVIMGNRLARAHAAPEDVVRAYLRDKALHFACNVRPALASGPVVTDRYVLSDVVYHHVLHDVPMERIRALMELEGLPLPDVIIFVDTPPEVAWSRINSRGKQLRPYERRDIITRLHRSYRAAIEANLLATKTIRYPNSGALDPGRVRALALGIIADWNQSRLAAGSR